MPKNLQELREKRGKAIHDARAILDAADAAKRAMTNEEESKYNELFAEGQRLKTEIEREERQQEVEREAAAQAGGDPERRNGNPANSPAPVTERRAAFQRFLAEGRSGLTNEEYRALTAGSNPQGGYLVAGEEFVKQLLQNVDDAVLIRQMATKFTIPQAASLGVPTLDGDATDWEWTTELGTGSDDDGISFGKRELHPKPLAKRVKISETLLRMAMMDVEAIVRERLAYKLAVTQEKHFMTGHGTNQPLGLFTASNDGIPTSRDVNNGNTTTAVTFDGLKSAKYALKGQYHGKANWLFHRNVVEQISKIKDLEGQYIWKESVVEGDPDRILGFPLMMSEFSPNTLTTGLYAGMLGDFSKYWIADTLDMRLQRLNELYAETNRVGFIGRMELDGMPVLPEAFVRVKLS